MARRIRQLLDQADDDVTWFMINAESITYMDNTAIETLHTLHRELAERGVTLTMARVKAPVRRILKKTGTTDLLGQENFFPTVRTGVRAYRERTGR